MGGLDDCSFLMVIDAALHKEGGLAGKAGALWTGELRTARHQKRGAVLRPAPQVVHRPVDMGIVMDIIDTAIVGNRRGGELAGTESAQLSIQLLALLRHCDRPR